MEKHEAAGPWHAGERAMQARLGVAERMAAIGPRMIHARLPEQHRTFYAQLPWLVLGAVDGAGMVWATVLEGAPGFVDSPDPGTLRVAALPGADDPAGPGFAAGSALGALGIEPATRRRNRVNGRVQAREAGGFVVAVEQAFGNCPQYIQARVPVAAGEGAGPVLRGGSLDEAARRMISAADTCFVASYVDVDGDPGRRSVDVSHRGGRPGFVRVDGPSAEGGDVLTMPDFAGNLQFNTLGNLLTNPRAGLLFVDFVTGDVLQVSGATELVFAGEEVARFEGAERLWRLRVAQVVRRPGALRWRWRFVEFARTTLDTGRW